MTKISKIQEKIFKDTKKLWFGYKLTPIETSKTRKIQKISFDIDTWEIGIDSSNITCQIRWKISNFNTSKLVLITFEAYWKILEN